MFPRADAVRAAADSLPLSAARKTHGGSEAPRNPHRNPRRVVHGSGSDGDEDRCDEQDSPADPDLGFGINPGSVSAAVCFHCVLSGAGEKDASAATHAPPAPVEKRDRFLSESGLSLLSDGGFAVEERADFCRSSSSMLRAQDP